MVLVNAECTSALERAVQKQSRARGQRGRRLRLRLRPRPRRTVRKGIEERRVESQPIVAVAEQRLQMRMRSSAASVRVGARARVALRLRLRLRREEQSSTRKRSLRELQMLCRLRYAHSALRCTQEQRLQYINVSFLPLVCFRSVVGLGAVRYRVPSRARTRSAHMPPQQLLVSVSSERRHHTRRRRVRVSARVRRSQRHSLAHLVLVLERSFVLNAARSLRLVSSRLPVGALLQRRRVPLRAAVVLVVVR